MGNTPIDIFRRPYFGLGDPLPEDSASEDEDRVLAGPRPEAGERFGDAFASAPERFAGVGAPRSLLVRDAAAMRSRLFTEAGAGGFLGFTAGLEDRAEALAFFRAFQVFREPGNFEPQILSTLDPDAETLEQALRHFEALYGENFPGSATGALAPEHATIFRILARGVAAQNPELADAAQRLENERLLCRVYAALLGAEGNALDREALSAAWLRWREELAQYPVDAEVLIQDCAAMAEIIAAQELPELRALLSDSVQAQVEAWRRPAAGTDPRAAILGRQRAFELLRGTWEALGETGRRLFLDLTEELDRDALGLEREAVGAEPALRLQLLGEVAALYRRLAGHPEAGEHYRARLRATLESLLEAAGGEAVDPGLRLQAFLQVAREFEAEGDTARAEAIRTDLSARAERALRRGGRSRASILDRYADLREALSIYRELGPESSREAASRSLESLLRGVLESAARRGHPELRRETEAFALEGYLELGDLEAAEILWRGLRAGLPRPTEACREGGAAAEMDVDACAAWLRRLGAYAQRLAVARADGGETAPDFSLFREVLEDLAALGARNGRRTMARYGRFMLAVLDRDPAAETLYEQLQGAGSPGEDGIELPIHELLLAASGAPPPHSEVEPDEYQRMAREIWERHQPFLTLDRCLPTLGFLSQMIEGNYQQRLAAADEEGRSRIPVLAEREAMRRSLALVQQALVTGRAADTAAAIELLPHLLGDEDGARDFYRGLGGAFGYESLDGVEHRNTDLARRLIDLERSMDPEIRAQRYLSLAREMVVADSLNRRCDGLIAALLQAAEDSGARGRAPRPLMEILGNLAGDGRDLGDISELYNRLAGNETLQAQIQAFRDVTPYIQTMNQVVDSVFSVEGGAILLASIFTGGLAAELAGAALLARLGAGAYVVADGAVAMTWTARAAVGATRIAAAWAARSPTELGGIAVYRAATGRRQMDLEEVRLRLITSLFCSVGDEFATHFTRAFLGRALRPVFGETARGAARTRAATGVAEFFASGLGEMWGEDVGARVAGRAPDTRPFLVRYFEETLHGSFFVAGTRVGAPIAEAVTSRLRPAEPAGSGPLIDRNGLSEEGVPVEWEGSPLADAHPRRGLLVPGLIGREGNARIRHYRVRRLVSSEGRALVEVESLHPGVPAARFVLASPAAGAWEAGQELSFIPAIEGGSGRDEASGPRAMFFPLRLSQYALRGDEGGAPRMQVFPDPERPNRYRTSGHGFLIFRSEAGRVLGRDLESASRLTLFDPGSGIAVDSHLPVGRGDMDAFLEDFRDLREHLEALGFDFRRARVNLVYGAQEGAAAATTSHAGPILARRLEGLGIRFESVRAAESGGAALDFDLASGALLAEGEEVFRRAEAPTLPPSAPRGAVDASTFFLFEEWLESTVALAANQPELEEFTRGLGREWERREITFPTMIRRLRDYIRTETDALARPGLYASLAGALATQDLVEYAHAILEQESLSLQDVWPGEQHLWDTEEGLARVQLIRALVRNGVFEGEINPVYHLARIRDSGARYLAWRELLTGLVVRGQERRAQELLISFSSNSRVGTPAAERELLWTLFREIRSEFRGPRGGDGGTGAVAALLAAGAGAATLLGAHWAQAQESVALQDPTVDWTSWVALGGAFAAGLAYLYAGWRRSSGRLHLERIAALSDPARSEEERRELGEWLRREARENPEAFGAEAVRALRSDLRRESLPALDVYMALLETDHPVARQLLTAADVRRCEAMILAQVRGAEGLQRLLDAALRARVSARLIDAVAQRINHPFVGQQLVAGIVTGQIRPALVLLKAMEEAHPDRVETLEDLLTALRRSARRNYHARRFLERVLGRPDLARFHDQARVEAESPGRWGSGGSALAWLAAGAGGAAWLDADTAHAAVGVAEAAASGASGWLLGAGAALGFGLWGMVFSRDGEGSPHQELRALGRALFWAAGGFNFARESIRESFYLRFHRSTPLEKAERLRELFGVVVELSEAEDRPLNIDQDFSTLLLRQEDPRFAMDFLQALSGFPFYPGGTVGWTVRNLVRGLERRGVLRNALPEFRELRPEDSRPFRTPAWMQRFRELLAGGFSENLSPQPARLALRDVLPIHYLDNHARGDGAAALNAVRRSILSRLALQHWTPGRPPEEGALALALIDDESRLPIVSRPDARGRRLLLNGHHRIGALLSLVADGLLPEQTLERIPFHEASEVDPEALIRRALARASLPNPNHPVNWRELLAFDPTTRDWLDRRDGGGGGDLVAWMRELRTVPRGRRTSDPEE